jgi:hypothetical protein
LNRCLERHGISRLPDVEGDKPGKKTFKRYSIGYFHIDIAEVQMAEDKLHLLVAVDRTSRFAFAQLHLKAGKVIAAQFLRDLIAAVPYAIHTGLTDTVSGSPTRTVTNEITCEYRLADPVLLPQLLDLFRRKFDWNR